MKNYKRFYEQQTGRKVPKGWDIHHIDGNRGNNGIYNLLALPRYVHLKYHDVINKMNEIKGPLDFRLTYENINLGIYRMQFELQRQAEAYTTLCWKFVEFKYLLLNNYPILTSLY